MQNQVSAVNKHGNYPRRKCIECPCELVLSLRRITKKTVRTYEDLEEFPVFVKLLWKHNHPVYSSKSLSQRCVSEETLSTLFTMFVEGMDCQEAYDCCRSKAALTYSDSVSRNRSQESALADSSICPTMRQIRYRFSMFDQQRFGERNGAALWDHIAAFGDSYNSSNKGNGGRMLFHLPDQHAEEFLIAISTPVMTRVRQGFPEDCLLSFVDSTGSVDCQSLTVTFVMAVTCVGALPIGVIIAGEKTQRAYTKGFTLLRELTEDIDASSAWNPSVGMPDNDCAIRGGLQSAFPRLRLLLCVFHVLQQVWRHLVSRSSGIDAQNRVSVMQAFRAYLHANVSDFAVSKPHLFRIQLYPVLAGTILKLYLR
jgi:hypothetical protein